MFCSFGRASLCRWTVNWPVGDQRTVAHLRLWLLRRVVLLNRGLLPHLLQHGSFRKPGGGLAPGVGEEAGDWPDLRGGRARGAGPGEARGTGRGHGELAQVTVALGRSLHLQGGLQHRGVLRGETNNTLNKYTSHLGQTWWFWIHILFYAVLRLSGVQEPMKYSQTVQTPPSGFS